MALTPTNRWKNWGAVAFATIPITGIKRITFAQNITDLQDSADNDFGPTISLIVAQNPSFNIQTQFAYALIAQAAGVTGIFTATQLDAKNFASVGGGGFVFTTNSLSYLSDRTIDGGYNELAQETVMVKTTWADGVTNPVTISAA